jgi:steroid 5-alpha reductase family enzyme
MNALQLIVLIAVALALLMAAAWRVVLKAGKAGWADVFWSAGIGIGAIVLALLPLADAGGPSPRGFLVAAIAAVWALRLGGYILARTRQGGDDPRYVQLKAEWGDRYQWKLFGFLEIQAAAALVLVGSAMAAARSPGPLGWGDALGVVIAALAIGGEALSDAQLRSATPASGDCHATPIISSSGWSGSPMCRSASASTATPGAGPRCSRR